MAWEKTKLGDVCLKTSNIKWDLHKEDHFQYIDLSSVDKETLKLVGTTEINAGNAPSRAKKIVNTDDVIFATTRPTLRRLYQITDEHNNQICSTGYVVLRPKSDLIYSAFIYYFLQNELFMERMEKLQRGASYPAVTDNDVKNTPLLLPSLPEQKRIVEILDEAFADIAKARAHAETNLKNARELFDSYLQKVFTEKGQGWEEYTLGEIIDTLTDYHANGSYKILKQHVELKDTEDYAWMVRSTDFEKSFKNPFKYISEHAYNYLTKSKLFGGEIIMSKIGNAGKVYFMPSLERPCSLAMNLFLIRLNSEKANNELIYRYLNSISGQAQITPLLKGAATQTITKDSVRSIKVPLPSLKEQANIIDNLNNLEDKSKSLDNGV